MKFLDRNYGIRASYFKIRPSMAAAGLFEMEAESLAFKFTFFQFLEHLAV
jgi:hypothetical protein